MIAKLPMSENPIGASVPHSLTTAGRLKNTVALVVMVTASVAVVLMLVGTLSPHTSLQHWGELFSIPAILVVSLPFLCIGLLFLIWTGRAAVRVVVPTAFPRRIPAVAIDPLMVLAPQPKDPKIPLTDEQSFAYLRALDARNPLSRKGPAEWTAPPGAVSTMSVTEKPPAPVELPTPDNATVAVPFNPVKLAADNGVVCLQVESARNSFVLKVPTHRGALSPGSVFEQICRAFLQRPQQVEKLIIDGRQLDSEDTEQLREWIIRIASTVSDYAVDVLRVVFSESLSTFIPQLWESVQKYANGKDLRITVIPLYAALLTICLGPPPHLL